MKTEIGRMEEVEVRKLWKHEQQDFSSWLAEEQNIAYLNDILGLTLMDIQTEVAVGPYRCDLVASDESSNVKVIIENQLDKTDHDHLGKIITYAAGLNAQFVVWIVGKALDEHKAAIEWLNNNTDDTINFFLIELHAYRIGNSLPAPKFEPVIVPNDFVKYSKLSSKGGALTKSKNEQLIFWEQFNSVLADCGKPFSIRKPRPQHWYDVSIGTSKAHIDICLENQKHCVSVGLYIPNNKDFYDSIFKFKDRIEKDLGFELIWDKLDGKKASRTRFFINDPPLDFNDHSNYEELIKKIIDVASKMKKVFGKYVKKIEE